MSWTEDLEDAVEKDAAAQVAADASDEWLRPPQVPAVTAELNQVVETYRFRVFRLNDEQFSMHPQTDDGIREWFAQLHGARRFDRDAQGDDAVFAGLTDDEFLVALQQQWTVPQAVGFSSEVTDLAVMMFRGIPWVCKWDPQEYSAREGGKTDSLSWKAICRYLIVKKCGDTSPEDMEALGRLSEKLMGTTPDAEESEEYRAQLRVREYRPWSEEEVTFEFSLESASVSIGDVGEPRAEFTTDADTLMSSVIECFREGPTFVALASDSDQALFLSGGAFVVVDGLTAQLTADRLVLIQVQDQISQALLDPWKRTDRHEEMLSFWRRTFAPISAEAKQVIEQLVVLTAPECRAWIEVGELAERSNAAFEAHEELMPTLARAQELLARGERGELTHSEKLELEELTETMRRLSSALNPPANRDLTTSDNDEEEPAPRKRKPIPTRIKNEVWNRDGGRCVECGENENLEFDHIIPHSRGGADTYRNLQLLCQPCNRSKHASIG